MRKITLFLFVLLAHSAYSQVENIKMTTLDATVYTSFFDASKEKLLSFVEDKSINIANQNANTERMHLEFYTNKETFDAFQLFLPNLGFISENEISTINRADEKTQLELEAKYLREQQTAYETELTTMDNKNDKYYEYWEKVREIERDIYDCESKLSNYGEQLEYKVEINIFDETVDLTTSKISWVNMPGASFDMLFVETPLSSLSATVYQGYSLRYLFTRGKSYATLGVLKDNGTAASDSMRYEELFMFSFGQDWYTKHFGRGKNKFLNLYTGYNIGGMFATADARKKTIPYLKIFLGVELFKNKYIILDNKVGYFVPFYQNRNLRGITYNACFNFVF